MDQTSKAAIAQHAKKIVQSVAQLTIDDEIFLARMEAWIPIYTLAEERLRRLKDSELGEEQRRIVEQLLEGVNGQVPRRP